jgi:HEPN domain-containing protein
MKKLTADWLRKAGRDYRIARKLAPSRPPENDYVCFCCQQAAEKFLKALLVERSLTVPRTHNLEDLLGLLRPHHPDLFELRQGLLFLTRFAVDTRYPGFHTRRRQADAALRWAERVRTKTRAILGLRPSR